MSKATFKALEEAIAEHIASECGGAMLLGYVLKASGQTADGLERDESQSLWAVPDTQNVYLTLGLAAGLSADVKDFYRNTAGDLDDD